MAYSQNFPAQRPSFMFDASNSGRIPPNMTFSRADSPIDATKAAASAVHFWSNEKHLSSENLLLDSKTGTANWTGDSSGAALVPVVTANHAASPDGTASQATRVQLDLNGNTSSSDYARYYQTHNVASGTSTTFAVWMKSTDGTSSYAAQILSPAGPGVAVTITGSWQKFTVTANSFGNITYGVRLRGGQSPTNADTADILIWGANLSTTGQTVLSETTTQIHREYAPTLKSVATAGAARFEYDPTDGQSEGTSLGCLIEGQSTSLVTYSEDSTQWTVNNHGSTANAAIAPDGTLTASLMVPNSTPANRYFYANTCTYSSGTTYTGSVFVKAAGNGFCQLVFPTANFGTTAYANYTLSGDGAVSAGSSATGTIEAVGNGFYRVSLTATATASGSEATVIVTDIDSASDARFPNTTGNDYDGLIVWGFQNEASSFASSYIKSNSGSTTTRASDQLSVATADIPGFSEGVGTIVCETGGVASATPDIQLAFGLNGPASNNFFTAGVNNGGVTDTSVRVYLLTPDGDQAYLNAGTATVGTGYKLACRYELDNIAASMNGGTVVSDTSGKVPVGIDTLWVGELEGNYQLNSNIKRIAVYNEALTDTNLQALTS